MTFDRRLHELRFKACRDAIGGERLPVWPFHYAQFSHTLRQTVGTVQVYAANWDEWGPGSEHRVYSYRIVARPAPYGGRHHLYIRVFQPSSREDGFINSRMYHPRTRDVFALADVASATGVVNYEPLTTAAAIRYVEALIEKHRDRAHEPQKAAGTK